MLESISERLMETVHAGSPTKHPRGPARGDRGGRRAADPVHERHPRRHRRDRGGARRLARGARRGSSERHGHIQEVILQNFVPHPRYYGREVADIADEASRERWRRRRRRPEAEAADGTMPLPAWASPVTLERDEAARRRVPATDARGRHPDPAEPLRLVDRARRGRRHRPRRPLGQRRPHLARAPVPEPAAGPRAACGRAATR